MQRRRYKGSSREGRGESRPRLESRVVGSTRGSAACTLSVLLARSVHIESKSRRTIKADVSIWTCRDFLFFLLFSAFILPLPLFLWFHSPLPYSSLSFLFFFYFSLISSSFSRYTRDFLGSQFFAHIHLWFRILFLARLLYLTERELKITVLFIYHVSPVIKELLCALYLAYACANTSLFCRVPFPPSCTFDLMEWNVLVESCASCSILVEIVMEGRLIVLRLIFPCLKSFKDCDIYVRTYFSRFIYIYFFFFFFCLALCSDWKINLKFYYLTFLFRKTFWCVTFTTCNKITVKIYRNRNLCHSFKIERKKKLIFRATINHQSLTFDYIDKNHRWNINSTSNFSFESWDFFHRSCSLIYYLFFFIFLFFFIIFYSFSYFLLKQERSHDPKISNRIRR